MTYQKSQSYIARAEEALRSGDLIEARRNFLMAAELQHSYVLQLPQSRTQSRSTFGLSAATLFYRGNDLKSAAQLAHHLLAEGDIETAAQDKLDGLLSRIRNDRLLSRLGLAPNPHGLSVVFHGDGVGDGFAPQDEVDNMIGTMLNVFRRYSAMKNRRQFSPRIESRLSEQYRAFIAQPVLGSYRVDLFITQKQLTLDLDGENDTPANVVVDEALHFIELALRSDNRIIDMVPDEQYRSVLLRLLGNLIPDGGQVSELELRRHGQAKDESISLRADHRAYIRDFIQSQVAPSSVDSKATTETLVGILRAVDLDMKKLRLEMTGEKRGLKLPADFSEDVLGPLLNQRVRVTQTRPAHRKRFTVNDIERTGRDVA